MLIISALALWSLWSHTTTQKVLTLLFPILAISLIFLIFKKSRNPNPLLPPGPRGLPLLGYLPFLGTHLHRSFTDLAKTYGPIYKLWLGNKLCVVISSPELAKQVLRDQDAVFSNREAPISALIVTYGGNDIAFANNGPNRRKMRKIFVREMLSNASLDACHHLRTQEVRKALRKVREKAGSPVDVGELMFLTVVNVVISMLVGGSDEKESIDVSDIREVIGELMVLLGKPNISDFYPALARFDLQGIEKRSKKVLSSCERVFDTIIEQRMSSKDKAGDNSAKKNFSQILLNLGKDEDSENYITVTELKDLLQDIVLGGMDTTASMVEWVMVELMQHPNIMHKVQDELTEVVGSNNLVEESHLPKLAYLDAVVKETFRLHPTIPLLVPHCPSQSSIVGGYIVPEGTNVYLNVWAIHRDPIMWHNPLEFQPKRFLDDSCKVDHLGNNFQYLLFGSRRRVRAGMALAERVLFFLLASLLHSFEWKLPEGEVLDLSNKFGIPIEKMNPLNVIPTPRFSKFDLYT